MLDQVRSAASRLSRRELGRVAVAAMTGAIAAVATPGETQTEQTHIPVPDIDTRLTQIEKSRGKPFTEEQRKAVLKNIQDTDDSWAKGRKGFTVPDQTEPDFVFRPTTNERRRRGETNG
jgi:hypothetical protein